MGALASEVVQKYLEGKEPKKVIVANKRLVSIVIEESRRCAWGVENNKRRWIFRKESPPSF
jgi:hypothetical protein